MSHAHTTTTLEQLSFASAASATSRARHHAQNDKARAEARTNALTQVARHVATTVAVGAQMAVAYLFALLLLFWHVAFVYSLL